ncbi:MAG: POTRA domain-containing protein [Acidobacteriota bacterium]|nr:POTRA domain-containing protein [Acidobacteriota bacterium]HNQ80472.1 POTRA domain-containing protein [Candidatus Aminicenantes bacterium]MDD8033954.1 POTRA domain-containing protein [Acidobacteriota bacterium]MDD8039272.1 POTRA domain-containing protein [Acidobacteriota bacterium]HNT31919.1 POTRA domain-containing protein [Candidatus Aminicenantes bacterium]
MPRSGKGFRAVLALLAVLAAAESRPASAVASGARISAVLVRVEGEEIRPDLRSLVPIADGDPFLPVRIDEAVKRINETGLFSDIEVRAEGEEDVRLTFLLTRKLFTRRISFSGEVPVSRKSLLSGLYALRPETEFSEPRLRRAEEELRENLRREGFFDARATGRAVPDPARRFVDLEFTVEAGRRFSVRNIEFRGGLGEVQAKAVKSLATRPGRPYRPAVLESDLDVIRAAYRAAGYPRADVAVQTRFFRAADASVGLVLGVDPRERIRITIRGAEVPESLVRPLWEERIFEEWGLKQAEAAILTSLRRKGHVFAVVRSSIEREAGDLHIIHQVDPGPKIRISSVVFEGLTAFSEAEIRRRIGLAPRLPLFGSVSGDQLFAAPEEVETLYEREGYPDAGVTLQFRERGDGYQAVFVIDEGPVRTIRSVVFRNISLVPENDLRRDLECRESGPYEPGRVRRDAERLESRYLNGGIRGTAVAGRAEALDDGRFDVFFDIQEGTPVRIDKIVVSGNAVTRRDVIDRALLLREGDPARADLILESKRRLEKLGVFVEVKIEEILSTESGRETLVVSLREGARNYAGLGVGLETKNEPMTFEIWNNVIRPRFSAEFIRGNMLGRAAQLSLIGQFSLKEKRAVASWESPAFFGLPFQSSVNAWLEREERVSYGFDRRGFSLSGFRSIGPDWTSLTTLRFARTTLYFLEVEESEIDRQHYPYSATSLSESLIWDARDDSFNPTRGLFFSAVLEWAYPLFKVESDYLKSFVKFQYFQPIGGRILLLGTFRSGLGMGRIPIHERFFAGGSGTFRGRRFDDLGPKDAKSGKPVGGKALILFNIDAQIAPFSSLPGLSLAVFYDRGNVFASRKDVGFDALEDALGFGFRYKTPLGPLRVDLGWNLDPSAGGRGPRLYVTIGNVF